MVAKCGRKVRIQLKQMAETGQKRPIQPYTSLKQVKKADFTRKMVQ